MKIGIYDPYLDDIGGGEKYMMSIAEVLSLENIVDVLLDRHLKEIGGDYLKNKLSKRRSAEKHHNKARKRIFFKGRSQKCC